jgi:hypothetical protein
MKHARRTIARALALAALTAGAAACMDPFMSQPKGNDGSMPMTCQTDDCIDSGTMVFSRTVPGLTQVQPPAHASR